MKEGITFDGRHYTADHIWLIVRVQSAMRMWLAKKRVSQIRQSRFHSMPGMTAGGPVDFDNIHVRVSNHMFQTVSDRAKMRLFSLRYLSMHRDVNLLFMTYLGNAQKAW